MTSPSLMPLLMDSVLLDVSSFANHPTRTGIQRMLQAFIGCRAGFRLMPFIVLPNDRIGILPIDYFERCMVFFDAEPGQLPPIRRSYHKNVSDVDENYLVLRDYARPIAEIEAERAYEWAACILNWDYTFQHEALRFYLKRLKENPRKLFIIVIDFLLWTHFECFSRQVQEHPLHTRYLMLLRRARNLCFISEDTRQVFLERIALGWRGNGVVVLPGGDALGTRPPKGIAKGCDFVVVGTVEPRKHSAEILTLFEELVERGHRVSVTFLGTLLSLLKKGDFDRFQAIKDSPGPFRWIDKPSDKTILDAVTSARAVISISAGEGYGAPPVEALALGIPCITSSNLPSVRAIGGAGQVVIRHDDWNALRKAIVDFSIPDFAKSKQREIASLNVPRWRDFASSVLSWCIKNHSFQAPLQPFGHHFLELELGQAITALAPAEREAIETEQMTRVRSTLRAAALNARQRASNAGELAKLLAQHAKETEQIPSVVPTIGRLEVEAELTARWYLHEQQFNLAPADYVIWLGTRYLGRELSLDEVVPHVESFGATANYVALILVFATCDEARRHREDPFLEPWSEFLNRRIPYQLVTAPDHICDNRAFIRACYQQFLGRKPDDSGLESYLKLLQQPKGRIETLKSLLLSEEHVSQLRYAEPYLWALSRVGVELPNTSHMCDANTFNVTTNAGES